MSLLIPTALIQIIFIILRLCNVITWNWYLVFIPSYIDIGITFLIIIMAFITKDVDNIVNHSNKEE